jgi:hypothetical protein
MSISNQINHTYTHESENTVYFYPEKVKISYSSLEDLKYFLAKICGQELRLEEKLRQTGIFLKQVLRELYRQGLLDEDHTMVITDPLINREDFLKALDKAFKTTTEARVAITKLTKTQLFKRQLLASIYLKKQHPLIGFINLSLNKGEFYSSIINTEIDLKKHKTIKFVPTVELEEYTVNIMTRKALLSQGSSIFSMQAYIYIIIELVIWYSRAFAYLENSTEVTNTTLTRAIKLVDNYYIADPAFIKMLQGVFVGKIIKILT